MLPHKRFTGVRRSYVYSRCGMSLKYFERAYEKEDVILQLGQSGPRVGAPIPWQEALSNYRSGHVGSNTSEFVDMDDEPKESQKEDFLQNPLIALGINKGFVNPGNDFDEIKDAEGPFGISVANPIPVNGPIGETVYINRLRSKSGVGFLYHRIGSLKPANSQLPIDAYELVSIDASEWHILYFTSYNSRRSNKVPEGFSLVGWSSMNDFQRVACKLDCFGTHSQIENFPFELPSIIEIDSGLASVSSGLGKQMAGKVEEIIKSHKENWKPLIEKSLLKNIDSTHYKAFWYDSPLLRKCETHSNSDLVKSLAIRHNALANKEAGSCQVLRQAIKNIEGPEFPTLWNMFDNDPEDPEEGSTNPESERWTAGFILGEIGGLSSLSRFMNRLDDEHRHIHYAVVRCITHIVTRYFSITEYEEPKISTMDVKTGVVNEVLQKEFAPDIYRRTIEDRKQADEYFVRLSSSMASELREHLALIESDLFNVDKNEFIELLKILPIK